jgi:hypothetical protein
MKRWIALSILSASCLSAQALTQSERDYAMSELQASRKMFLDSVAGLTPAQWTFKASPERWSIAECAEHITVSEDFIFNLVPNQVMKTPATPEKREAAKAKDETIVKLVTDRSHKAQAPEPIKPTHRWDSMDAMIDDFKTRRDRNIAYVETTRDALRDHFFPHPMLGPLDGYQWILLLSAHSERHTAQILEVKADANYPK